MELKPEGKPFAEIDNKFYSYLYGIETTSEITARYADEEVLLVPLWN